MTASPDTDPLGAFSATADQYAAFVRGVADMLADAGAQPVTPVIDKLLEQLRRQLDAATPLAEPVAAWLESATRLFAGPDTSAAAHSLPLGEWTDAFWSMPLLGPGRDWQRLARSFNLALSDYAEAQGTLGVHYRRAMTGAIDAFREEVLGASGVEVLSLTELHRRWTEIADRCYREVAMSDDFSRDFGNAINRASAVRKRLREVTGRVGLMFGIPDQQALRDIDVRLARLETVLQETRREQRDADAAAATAPATGAAPAATTTANTTSSPNKARRASAARKPAPTVEKPAARRKSPASRGKSRRKGKQVPEFDVGEFLGRGD